MFKVLDLFAGIGGTARGIHRYLEEKGIKTEYYAFDNNDQVLLSHKLINPNSIIINFDAWKVELDGYDFIWASPPCQSHSKINNIRKEKDRRPIDMRLYELIEKLQQQSTPFIVENVNPYYDPPIKPILKCYRHVFWSNLPLVKPSIKEERKGKYQLMSTEELMKLHNLTKRFLKPIHYANDKRTQLRNMVNSDLAYELFKQVLQPEQRKIDEYFIQEAI